MTDLYHPVLLAADRPEVVSAVGGLYAAVQRAVDARRPVCVVSGRCCRFEEYGHRLFVTTMELAAFLHELRGSAIDTANRMAQWDGRGCPFQLNKLCSVHRFRPF